MKRRATVVLAVLLVGADSPTERLGEARPEFQPRSVWVSVRASKGITPLQDVVFVIQGPFLAIRWHWVTENGQRIRDGLVCNCELDSQTGLPTFSGTSGDHQYEGHCRLVGRHLRVTVTNYHPQRRAANPPGELHLILKRVK
jgi:hypothetical protein